MDYIVYIGTVGLGLGIIFFLIFLFRRIRRLLFLFSSRKDQSAKLVTSLKSLILILLWSSVFGMLMFISFFLRAYQVFTLEKPVAEIKIIPTSKPQTMKIDLVQMGHESSNISGTYEIKGDQWTLEGDIIKWDNWLNFAGLQTRYRFTRIRGRYLKTEDEIARQPTIYSLVKDENSPLWRYLYEYGHKLPFVSTVYGNAVFQYGSKKKKFLVYVTNSGFIVRQASNQ